MCIYKWMKIKMSKLQFITFLKNIKYTCCYCICDLAPYIFENIHGTKPQIEGTVSHATSIRSKRHTESEISKHSHTFWCVLRLVRIKNTGPLCFELTRFHCNTTYDSYSLANQKLYVIQSHFLVCTVFSPYKKYQSLVLRTNDIPL